MIASDCCPEILVSWMHATSALDLGRTLDLVVAQQLPLYVSTAHSPARFHQVSPSRQSEEGLLLEGRGSEEDRWCLFMGLRRVPSALRCCLALLMLLCVCIEGILHTCELGVM